ncbi:hypothetical protein [Nocardiopsis sp. NPDC006938]|uniref:hypothetical protein n=1 Tax=Nocardiopsis sp. NPDC006938 TaxID=3364337 RepID=UPI0036757DAD
MPTPATHAPHRPRLSSVLGAAFVGSALVAVMSPAHADPAPSAVVSFASEADTVELGTEAPPNTLSVTNTGPLPICLIDLGTDAPEFSTGAPDATLISPNVTTRATVTGAPRQDATVTALLRYAAAPEDGRCQDVDEGGVQEAASNAWTVTVTEPVPSPTPTPTPTDSPTASPTPTEEPSERPTRTPSPSPTESASSTPSPSPTPSRTPTPSPTASESSSRGGSGHDRAPARTPNRPPSSTVETAPTSGADIPTLPRDEADLPDLAPGASQDLAELPLVTPTANEDNETEIAADHSDMGPSIAPAVLLAAFLLALLLATPLAPARRVRLGGGYQGRRRRT